MHSSIFDAAITFRECDMHPFDEESEKHSFQVEIEEGGCLIDF